MATNRAETNDTLDRAETDEAERKALWRCLAAYEMTNDYEGFAALLRLDATQPATDLLYGITHWVYLAAWNRYGWARLQTMIRIGWQGLYLYDGSLT